MKRLLLVLGILIFLFSLSPSIVAQTITATVPTGNISACAGTASVSPLVQQFTVSGSSLTANITATAPAGFEVSLAAGSGYSNSVTLTQTGGTVNNTVVYVRSAASAPSGNISGNVVISSAGATDQNVAVAGTVNALPTVNAVANQTVLNGSPTTAINFTGTGSTFDWVNNTPSIGLAASGTANIASFTAINIASTPVVATITVTPISVGFAYIANGGNNTVSVINTATNVVVTTILVGADPAGVWVSPDGSLVYVANQLSNTVSVINTATNTVVANIPVGSRPVDVSVSPDGSKAYVTNQIANTVSVINTTANTVVATIPVGVSPFGVSTSPDGSKVYVVNGGSNTVSVINTVTNAVIATIPVGVQPFYVSVSPDGSRAYVTNEGSNNISVINTATNSVIATIPVGTQPEGITISPDGNTVYVANAKSPFISVISSATNMVVSTIPVGSFVPGLAITPDGSRLYVANDSTVSSIIVFNTSTNARIANIINSINGPTLWGNCITGGTSCNGVPVTFTITVNPTLVPTIAAGTVTGSISACAGTASVSPLVQQFTVSGSSLTANITATAPAGFEVSLAAGSGYSNSVTLTQTGGTVNNTVVYVRSAVSAPSGNISGNVVLASAGATSQNVAVTGTVNALPTVNAVPNQTVLNGAPTTAINFTGTGNVFNWVNNTPGIGLAASGTGNIASFIAINNGSIPIVATITATPLPPEFAYIPNSGSNSVSVINTATNTVIATIPVGTNPQDVSISPDGSLVYVTNYKSNTLSVISTNTNTVVSTINVGSGPQGVYVSPDGKLVYVGDAISKTISVINTATNTVIATDIVGSYPYYLTLSPDGSLLYVSNYFNNTNYVSVFNTSTNIDIADIPVGAAPWGLAVSPDGSRVYVTNANSNTIQVINTSTNTVVNTITVGTNPYGIVVNPNGSFVYVTNVGSSTVSVINTSTNIVVATIPVVSGPYGISVSPDGSKLYVVDNGTSSISVISTSTNKVIATIGVGSLPVSFGNFVTGGSGCSGVPVTFTITVNPKLLPPAITAGTVTGSISACVGTASASPDIQQLIVSGSNLTADIIATAPTGFEVSLAAGSGYGSSVTLTQTGGIVDSIVVYVRSAATAPSGNISGNVVLTSAGATSQNIAVTGTVNTQATPSVIISSSANNICAGSPVTFTAVPTNGGNAPAYQWLLNGNNVGTNSSTYFNSMLTNGDVVSCVMTSNSTCAAGIATSNSIMMNVTASQVIPSVSISASANNICAGTPVTFTASPTNGGNAPAFQWIVNGNDSGTNSSTFISNALNNGDSVFCIMTGGTTCTEPVSSPAVYMVVYPLPIVTFSPDTVYTTNNSGVQLTPIITGTIAQYQWSPTDGLSSTDIAGPVADPANSSIYQLLVTTDKGCTATGKVTVFAGRPLLMPSAFTPNSDGHNDVFRIPPGVQFNLEEFDIFNRWGSRVFTTRNISKGWDGTYNGVPADVGGYVYMIKGKTLAGEPVFLKGTVVLIR